MIVVLVLIVLVTGVPALAFAIIHNWVAFGIVAFWFVIAFPAALVDIIKNPGSLFDFEDHLKGI